MSHKGDLHQARPGAPAAPLAVILTCHAPYLGWLPAALASIDRQLPAGAERVLVCDGCAAPPGSADHWRQITGSWGHMTPARNAGMQATSAPWLIFWDADNLMADGYIAALLRMIGQLPEHVAIIYPDLQYCDEQMRPRQRWSVPDWDYWALRAGNYIDTAAAWRRGACELAGGWAEAPDLLDDYDLALRITALGWQAARLAGPPVLMRQHRASALRRRLDDGSLPAAVWRSRSLAIVSLLAGRDQLFDRWLHFLRHAELPPRTALYVLDNSGRPAFRRMAFEACRELAAERGFTHLDLSSGGAPYRPGPAEAYLAQPRHLHVARLYAALLPRVGEDLILTLEDDIVPPLDAARRLGAAIGYAGEHRVGAVAAAYAMPHRPDHEVCAGYGDTTWDTTVRWEQLRAEPCEVGFVGGGCTVWASWAISACPVHLDWAPAILGWDAVLCRHLRRNGYAVLLHGGVTCEHDLAGRVQGVEERSSQPVASAGRQGPAAAPDEQALVATWARALAGDAAARSQWQTVEGGGWGWQPDGAVVQPDPDGWAALGWVGRPGPLPRNLVIELGVSGGGGEAGLSFGPYKDFLVTLEPGRTRRLQLEIDGDAGCWTFRADGQLMPRCWWDSSVQSVDDLLGGVFTLKAHGGEQVRFHDLALHSLASSCRLSVIITCHLFLQRLRVTLRNWCRQSLPAGALEVLVVNPGSPDGTHEHLAAVARSFPHLRVREIPAAPAGARNKASLINHGLRASRGAWVWLTDADCLFGPESAAQVLNYVNESRPRLFFGERRHLSAAQTDALLAGRLDGLHDFAELARGGRPGGVDREPWGYTQIVPRHVLEATPYPDHVAGFDRSDLLFAMTCARQGLLPEQVPGLFCLHLDHPFAWNGAECFL